MSFRWKDYSAASQPAIMTLQATEFIRRFLLHVLPRGFVKIRHFGFLANRGREDNIRLCRALLDAQSPNVRDAAVTKQEQPNPPDRCPLCNEGRMRPIEILLPQAAASRPPLHSVTGCRRLKVILHEAARATPSIGNACATREVAWEPCVRPPNRASNAPARTAVPTLQAQREPSPGLLTSRLSRFKSHNAAA